MSCGRPCRAVGTHVIYVGWELFRRGAFRHAFYPVLSLDPHCGSELSCVGPSQEDARLSKDATIDRVVENKSSSPESRSSRKLLPRASLKSSARVVCWYTSSIFGTRPLLFVNVQDGW